MLNNQTSKGLTWIYNKASASQEAVALKCFFESLGLLGGEGQEGLPAGAAVVAKPIQALLQPCNKSTWGTVQCNVRFWKNKSTYVTILNSLDNLSKYGNITLKFAGRYFYLLVTIFSKNRAILVQKLWGEKKLSKSVFDYFKSNKNFKKF